MEEVNRSYKPVEFGWLVALSSRNGPGPTRRQRPARAGGSFLFAR